MRLRVCSLLLLFMAMSINEICGEEGAPPTKSEDKPTRSKESKKKVLIYNPHLGYYHTKFMSTIANLLDEESYDVTMLDSLIYTNLAKVNRRSGITVLEVNQNAETKIIGDNGASLPDGLAAFWGELPAHKQVEGFFGFYRKTNNFDNLLAHQCKDVLTSKAFEELMNTQFDLLITEVFDLCGLGLFDKLNSGKVIITSSVPLHEYFEDKLGLTIDSSVPTKFSLDTLKMHHGGWFSGLFKFENGVQSALFRQNMFGYLEEAETKIFNDSINFEKLMRNAHALLENVHPLLDWPGRNVEGSLSIGGITVTPGQKLKEDITDLINEGKKKRKNIVLISFGTVMNHDLMENKTITHLINALESVSNAVFFWKVDPELLKKYRNIPPNVIAREWLEQNDLLASGMIDLFVSHMGIGSYTEAAYAGVPLVAVPIFVDQHYNYACANKLGIAHWVDKNSLATSPDDLRNAIEKALGIENNSKSAKLLAEKLKKYGDQRKKMMDKISSVLNSESDGTPFTSNISGSRNQNIYYYVAYCAVRSVIFGAYIYMFAVVLPLICHIYFLVNNKTVFIRCSVVIFACLVAVFFKVDAEFVYKTIPDHLNQHGVYAEWRLIYCTLLITILYAVYWCYRFRTPEVNHAVFVPFCIWLISEFVLILALICRWKLLNLLPSLSS